DGDVDGGGGTVGLAVVGFVSEAVRTIVVERRGVAEAAVAVECQGAVSGAADLDSGERIAINVAVIGQHTRCVHREGGVFGRGVTVVGDDRAGSAGRIVDRSDGDADGGGGTVGLAIVGFVSE